MRASFETVYETTGLYAAANRRPSPRLACSVHLFRHPVRRSPSTTSTHGLAAHKWIRARSSQALREDRLPRIVVTATVPGVQRCIGVQRSPLVPSLYFQINLQARKLRGRDIFHLPVALWRPSALPFVWHTRPQSAQLTLDRTMWAPMAVVSKSDSLLPRPATSILH